MSEGIDVHDSSLTLWVALATRSRRFPGADGHTTVAFLN